MKLAKCPYCGRRLSYHTAFYYKNKGEYECSRCNKKSNVSHKKTLWLALALTVLVAAIIMIIDIVYYAETEPFVFLTVFIPFILFYLFVPFFVNLRPLKKYREFVNRRQRYNTKPDIIAPIEDSDYGTPGIDRDAFNRIKSKRKIITEDEYEATRAFDGNKEFEKVETDTISTALLNEKTTSFNIKHGLGVDNEDDDSTGGYLDDILG